MPDYKVIVRHKNGLKQKFMAHNVENPEAAQRMLLDEVKDVRVALVLIQDYREEPKEVA